MRLDGKISASVDVVSGVPQGSVLGQFVVYIERAPHSYYAVLLTIL